MGAARTSAFIKSTTARKSAFAVVTLSVGATMLVAGLGSPALAATGCPSGATLIAGSVCEVVFTSSPSSAWTPPAGVTRVDALLVGAGGAGLYQYGGGGADVQIVTLATTGEVTITVGVGVDGDYTTDEDSTVTQGSNTTTAAGGLAPESSSNTFGGSSGNGYESLFTGGSGAGGSADDNDGGPGLVVSDIPDAAGTLFGDDTSCYGGGGASYFNVNDLGSVAPGCGGGSTTDTTSTTGVAPVANSGGGGASWYEYNVGWHGQKGADGKVVLRYPTPTLPDTGAGDSTQGFIAGLGALLVGLGAVMFGRRRKA
jgi:LPXTG-motif cell wall-anchored protein